MPINVSWQNEDQGIVYSQLVGHWNMKQFQAAWQRGYELMQEQAGQSIDFIIDLRQSILIPPDFVRQFRQMQFDQAQNLGQVIFVGADEHMQILIRTLVRSLTPGLEVSFAEEVEEAITLIGEGRLELMPLSA